MPACFLVVEVDLVLAEVVGAFATQESRKSAPTNPRVIVWTSMAQDPGMHVPGSVEL